MARHLSSNHRPQKWWLFIMFTQAPYFWTLHCILLSSAIVSPCLCLDIWISSYALTLLKIIVYTHRAQHECSPKSCGLESHWLTEGVLAKAPKHTHTVKNVHHFKRKRLESATVKHFFIYHVLYYFYWHITCHFTANLMELFGSKSINYYKIYNE